MRYIILIIGLLCGSFGANAEGLKFDRLGWNFGIIEELGGSVTHTFEFRNSSSKPVVIHNIKTTCGCTTPEYSRKPIAAGGISTLSVTFDPRFRPGIFKKDIYVYSTASSEPIVLYIEGRVTPRVLSVEEHYPYKLGSDVRLGAMYITISEIESGGSRSTSVEYYNGGGRSAKVDFRPRSESKWLKLFYDEQIEAGKGANLDVGYFIDTEDIDGVEEPLLRDTLDIYVNGRASGKSLFLKGVWSR